MTTFLQKLDSKIRLKPAPGSYSREVKWANKDLDPIEKERRTWTKRDVVSYWTSDQFAPATFELGSSLVGLGLTLREVSEERNREREGLREREKISRASSRDKAFAASTH